MEYFDRVVEFVFDLVGLDKHQLKAVIFNAGLGPAWIEISRFVAALGLVLIPLCFWLEHWLPAVPRQRILNPHSRASRRFEHEVRHAGSTFQFTAHANGGARVERT